MQTRGETKKDLNSPSLFPLHCKEAALISQADYSWQNSTRATCKFVLKQMCEIPFASAHGAIFTSLLMPDSLCVKIFLGLVSSQCKHSFISMLKFCHVFAPQYPLVSEVTPSSELKQSHGSWATSPANWGDTERTDIYGQGLSWLLYIITREPVSITFGEIRITKGSHCEQKGEKGGTFARQLLCR